jgi:hypothetical protein
VGWFRVDQVNLDHYWDMSARVGKHPVGGEALEHSNLLNTKVSALLGHVSLMVVTSTVFLVNPGIQTKSWINIALIVEVTFYITIALLCLLAIWITRPPTYKGIDDLEAAVAKFAAAVHFRKTCYYLALNGSFAVTAFFIPSFIYKVLQSNIL